MYVPPAFAVSDPATLERFMDEHSFATLVTWDGQGPIASHVPLVHDVTGRRLLGHLARANGQWRQFGEPRPALAIFQGPHAYISPKWYREQPSVPTWNYLAVHVTGRAQVVADPMQARTILRQMVAFYEGPGPEGWSGDLPAEYEARMLQALVAFELRIEKIEGKFKLSQNRSAEDIAAVANALAASANPDDQRVAAWMRRARPQGSQA